MSHPLLSKVYAAFLSLSLSFALGYAIADVLTLIPSSL